MRKRKRYPQKLITFAICAIGLFTLGVGGFLLVERLFWIRIARGVVLTDTLRDTSYWGIVATPQGRLIRPTGGRYKGWYLDAEETLGGGLVLSKRIRESSYWTLVEIAPLQFIQATRGPFRGKFIDVSGLLVTREGSYPWKIGREEGGWTIQDDVNYWYLDVDDAAEEQRVRVRSSKARQRAAEELYQEE